MKNDLDLVRHLYGELENSDQLEDALSHDAELAEEYRSFRAIREGLNRRERPRPDAAVLDVIMAAAEQPAPLHGARQDRPAVAHRIRRFDRLRIAGAAILTVFAVTIGVLQLRPGHTEQSTQPVAVTEQSTPATSPAEPLVAESIPEEAAASEMQQPTVEEPRVQALAAMKTEAEEVTETNESSEEEAPVEEWDAAPDVRLLQRRIEMLGNRATPTGWGQSIAPASGQQVPTLVPAGSPDNQ